MSRQDYIANGINTVAGWMQLRDAKLFDAIDAKQRELGITGDLLEIGCYQGTSAILLGYMRDQNERLVICDLFDGTPQSPEDDVERERYYAPNIRQGFEANYLRFHPALPEIIASPSSSLYNAGLGRTFRFIHIDGSHAYEQVRSDLLLAKQLLIPGGAVVFDDITSPHTPGVQAAVWEGVLRDALVPLFQTIKLYATWSSPFNIDLPAGLSSYSHTVLGHTMLHIEG